MSDKCYDFSVRDDTSFRCGCGEGSGLPEVTIDDNGKTLVVQNGSWTVGNSAGGLQNIVDGSSLNSVRTTGTNIEDSQYTLGVCAFSEGGETYASGDYSHAEGYRTSAIKEASHAEGSYTIANGDYAHAEGIYTSAYGNYSHVEGQYVTTPGEGAHAEGYRSTGAGLYSHAEGHTTRANNRSQHVFGELNITDNAVADNNARGTYVEIVGNGNLDTHQSSNARTLDWSGNEWLAGTLTVNSNGITIGSTTITEAQLQSLLALL